MWRERDCVRVWEEGDKVFCLTDDGLLCWCTKNDFQTRLSPEWRELRELYGARECGPRCCEESAKPAKAKIRKIPRGWRGECLIGFIGDIEYVQKRLSCDVGEAIEVIRFSLGR